jgi:hypothetical protein
MLDSARPAHNIPAMAISDDHRSPFLTIIALALRRHQTPTTSSYGICNRLNPLLTMSV